MKKQKAVGIQKPQLLPRSQIRSDKTRKNRLENRRRMRNQHDIAHRDGIGYEIYFKTRHGCPLPARSRADADNRINLSPAQAFRTYGTLRAVSCNAHISPAAVSGKIIRQNVPVYHKITELSSKLICKRGMHFHKYYITYYKNIKHYKVAQRDL